MYMASKLKHHDVHKKAIQYCCNPNQYYKQENENLVKTLKITPRVLIYKKSLKLKNTYENVIKVTNNGLHERLVTVSTDCWDTTIRINPIQYCNNFLPPEKTLQIKVRIQPKEKANLNCRRHILIDCKHPNITFSIPIIIITRDEMVSLPIKIKLPSTTVSNFAYYEMIVYNMSAHNLQFNIKSTLSTLTLNTNLSKIQRKDYVKVLLKLDVKEEYAVNGLLKIKLTTGCYGDYSDIAFSHIPMKCSIFVDTLYIKFDTLRFNRSQMSEFIICNESNEDIFFLVNFSTAEEISYRTNKNVTLLDADNEADLNKCKNINVIDKYPSRHFQFKPLCGTIPAHSSSIVQVQFKPIIHKDFAPADTDIPPFMVSTSLAITTRDELCGEQKYITLKGCIDGPQIDLSPKIIDLLCVYYGEEQCANIKVTNLDDICDAHVKFYDLISSETAQVLIKPTQGLLLKPLQSDIFKMRFYSTDFGKFMMQLEFKVANGGIFSILIKGYSQQVRVKCFPEAIEIGNVPIAIPQKRLVLLTNPLMVPLTVECTIREDGYETPLVLNVCDVNEHLPINVNDPVYELMKSLEIESKEDESIHDFKFRYSAVEEEASLHSLKSVIDDDSSYSTEFEEQSLAFIPNISYKLVSYLKSIKVLDKLEGDKYVMDAALQGLLEMPYFQGMDKNKNYIQMDWTSLATDPKEIYCNGEIIRIKPNTAKILTVVIIPNIVGFEKKYIELRACPHMPTNTCDEHDKDLSQIVDTKQMVCKLWITYNCCVPEVIWDNVVIMQDQLYAGEFYEFEMSFKNNSNIGGFFYYDVVPNSNLGVMKFTNNKWKYFIEPGTKIVVPCKVKFKKFGFISLSGLIKFVGVYGSFAFQIKSEVLPPKVNYSPQTISHTVNVFEFIKLHIFIENATPTTTWFRLKLKDASVMSIEPEGAQLAPTGQVMYVTLSAFYRDPGTYKNMLYIIMEFETIEKIPVTLHIKGMPLFFEPEIRNENLDLGYVFCNTEEDYDFDKPNFSKVIKVINKGLRPYRVTLTRTKSTDKPTCRMNIVKIKIIIKPANFIVQPLSETYFTIFLNSCEASSLFSEYRIDIADLNDLSLAQSHRSIFRATFIMPQVTWSRRDITMDYYRTHKHKEQEQWEIIKLINVTQSTIESIKLKLNGPFKIKELAEHQFENELNFSMAGFETKQFFIMLDKALIRNRINRFYEGRLSCCANSRSQKAVYLRVNMFVPEITVKRQQVTLFTKNTEGGTYIEIQNTGDIPAIYKWKKLKEEWHYVNEDDDCQQVASVILSDLIHMLELQPSNLECDPETNMTLSYQKFKCFFKNLDDPIGITEILYDIIEQIDLMPRRYKLCFDEPEKLNETEGTANGIEVTNSSSRLVLNALETEIDELLSMPMNKQEYQEKLTKIGEVFNSNTIFLNQKFLSAVSSGCTANVKNQDSNEETCIFYTLDHIMNHLKLEDSYVLSPVSSETCDQSKTVYFFEKCGLLKENEKQLCPLHIPAIRKGYEVRAKFQLDIVGGKSQDLEIILVNLEQAIALSKSKLYLGSKPWYEPYQSKIYIQNITNYDVYLDVIKVPKVPCEKVPKLASGYLNIVGNLKIHLKPDKDFYLETMGLMGFNEQFKRELRIVVNDGEILTVSFSGHGTMPMLKNRTPKLKHVNQECFEIIEEYCLLRKLYYFDIFKDITEKEDNLKVVNEEEGCDVKQVKSFLSDISDTDQDSGNSKSSKANEKELRFFQLMQTYVFVNNNEDLPNADVLYQLLQTEKFLNHLRFNKDLNGLLNLVYQNYLQHQKSYDAKMPTNLKQFTIQPLPYHLTTYILDMGKLNLNQYRKFILQFEFLGPGKLIAACRSAIKIPGLAVGFGIVENTGNKDFVFYRAEEKSTNLSDKPYRNVNERLIDAEKDPKLKHAHSFDITSKHRHQRDTTIKDHKSLRDYYNSLNKSIYMDQKYHIILSKIFTNVNHNFSGTKITLTLLFKPRRTNYKPNQRIEDYLYIDLHLGPTQPILLQGLVVDGYGSETTITSSLT